MNSFSILIFIGVIFLAHLGLTATLPPVQSISSSPINLLSANITNFGADIDPRFQIRSSRTENVRMNENDFFGERYRCNGNFE